MDSFCGWSIVFDSSTCLTLMCYSLVLVATGMGKTKEERDGKDRHSDGKMTLAPLVVRSVEGVRHLKVCGAV